MSNLNAKAKNSACAVDKVMLVGIVLAAIVFVAVRAVS
jgi:hypothetical protein